MIKKKYVNILKYWNYVGSFTVKIQINDQLLKTNEYHFVIWMLDQLFSEMQYS